MYSSARSGVNASRRGLTLTQCLRSALPLSLAVPSAPRISCFPLKLSLTATMSKSAQATKNTITLKGSAQIVTEFFGYSINRSELF